MRYLRIIDVENRWAWVLWARLVNFILAQPLSTLAPVVQTLDITIRRINHYPVAKPSALSPE